MTVYLNVSMNQQLLLEALYRELARAIQSERKNAGLMVTDRIKLTIWSDSQEAREFLAQKLTALSKEVTAQTQLASTQTALVGEWEASCKAQDFAALARFSRA